MTKELEVHIEHAGVTRRVGTLRYVAKASHRTSSFEYDEGWLDDPDAFAIDPSGLPLAPGTVFKQSERSALPGAIRDGAPDRWGQRLIERAFHKAGKARTLNEVDYLLGMSDETRVGALRYRRPGEEGFDHDLLPNRVPPLIQLPALLQAADAVATRTETADQLRLLLNEGSPLGGARPKSVVRDGDGGLSIAKFPKPDDDRCIPHGEALAMRLAERAGLDVAPSSLLEVAGRPVVLVKRFDRVDRRRVPFVSAMTMLGLDDGSEETYLGIAEAIRRFGARPEADLRELFRRIVFTVLVSNLDDHLRNHGFLYAGNGLWSLSPAYDLNPVPIHERGRELATWISEEGPEARLELALRAARYFAVDDDEARTIARGLAGVLAGWRDVAGGLGMSGADIEAYESAFEHEEAAAARGL